MKSSRVQVVAPNAGKCVLNRFGAALSCRYCPGCIYQEGVAIPDAAEPSGFKIDCLWSAGDWHHYRENGEREYTITAPDEPGTYCGIWLHDLQYSCEAAASNWATNVQKMGTNCELPIRGAGRGSAGWGVKGVFDPPERLLTSFHKNLMVEFGGHLPTLPSF